ncbi:MAG: preprotein translocase subunit SecA [Gammaproteobacteria bacterium]|nr:preprotein translocase subunit SecA [Gammaproteobacteria bacterium]
MEPVPGDFEILRQIKNQQAELRRRTDVELGDAAEQLRCRVQAGEILERILTPAFALVTEAARRTIHMSHYDVQLLAGLTLTRCAIAEMATGEGKTLVATLPAFVHSLTGRGVHVMTVNQYLAERDYKLMKPIYRLLRQTVGLQRPGSTVAEKRAAYESEITYGVGPEFGFDYLRDQLGALKLPKEKLGERYRMRLRGDKPPSAQRIQRELAFAIVDEADSVLVDEARSALILSGSSGRPASYVDHYILARDIALALKLDVDYVVDERKRDAKLTDKGMQWLFSDRARVPKRHILRPWAIYVEQALKVESLLSRDVDYVVEADRVQIIDEFTGRRFTDRTWNEGLHQAVEVKEGVAVTEESASLLRISRQRFFRLYDNLCGMTGTATGCEREFREFLDVPVVKIPLRRPSKRKLRAPRFFADSEAKWSAIVEEIEKLHRTGQPVLVGTRTVRDSEELVRRLDHLGLRHRLLNAKQDEKEAEIIARAGQLKQITIATNMAGRGADIPLGTGVVDLGGLYVIGSEPHEAERIDRQLAGRCARQGDPGVYRLFVSAEDHVIQQFDTDLATKILNSLSRGGELHRNFSKELSRLQKRISRKQFEQRQQLFRRDKWLEQVLANAS